MKPHLKVEMTVGALREMTPEQLKSLQDNVLADGRWETHVFPEDTMRVTGSDYLGIWFPDGFFLGIEKDGYAHS